MGGPDDWPSAGGTADVSMSSFFRFFDTFTALVFQLGRDYQSHGKRRTHVQLVQHCERGLRVLSLHRFYAAEAAEDLTHSRDDWLLAVTLPAGMNEAVADVPKHHARVALEAVVGHQFREQR